jgi:subtilisin family serine protease
MRRLSVVILLVSGFFLDGVCQDSSYKFWIQLKDKEGSLYSLENPAEFLSQRAIDRRLRYQIPIQENDLPVSQVYLDSLRDHDVEILYSTKWMNAVVIEATDSIMADELSSHTFVSRVDLLYWPLRYKSAADKFRESLSDESLPSDRQLEMLNGHKLHEQGYRGEDMIIAVIDGGFNNADSLAGFSSLWENGQVQGIRNYVDPAADFFWSVNGSHGTDVLSTMGGYLPGEYRGGAVKAGYWLIQTEDVLSEFRIEEANWLAGAELADSAGADVINSSLGYSDRFTYPSQDYTYADMDGKTTLVTRAATLAASKGMLVVTSAGNSGRNGDPWQYIIAPSDGDSILGVGAVNADGIRAPFSSKGPSSDERIKPDVAAQGLATVLIRSNGLIGTGNGTSFSSPVLAGLATCLWQKHRDVTNYEIIQAIRRTASQYDSPDSLLGYGIPDLELADLWLSSSKSGADQLHVFPNPATRYVNFWFPDTDASGDYYEIIDITGRKMIDGRINSNGRNQAEISVESLTAGLYIILVHTRQARMNGIFIKQ